MRSRQSKNQSEGLRDYDRACGKAIFSPGRTFMKQGLFWMLMLLVGIAKAGDALPEFRGIRLGSVMTQAQIMHALGADQFKVDPEIDIWTNDRKREVEKHGMTYVLEQVEFEIGPYCKNDGPKKFYCNNPRMQNVFGVGRDHGIRGTEIFVENGIVHSIDVTFDSLDEGQFLEAIFDKYGKPGWKAEKDPYMVITNLENKSNIQVERHTFTKKTHDYTIMTTNYDMVFTHPFDMYKGIMEIQLIDRNF
jgi:hypothetical protein